MPTHLKNRHARNSRVYPVGDIVALNRPRHSQNLELQHGYVILHNGQSSEQSAVLVAWSECSVDQARQPAITRPNAIGSAVALMLAVGPAIEHASVRLEKEPRLAADMDYWARTRGAYGRTFFARLRIAGAVALLGLLPTPPMFVLR